MQQWDHSQRKVIRYDRSLGDNTEPKGGHGTKVAGAASGRSRDDYQDAANGIAENAKLHVFDIQRGSGMYQKKVVNEKSPCSKLTIMFIFVVHFSSGGYKMPSAFDVLRSMHSTNGNPARVANGSWNTRYRSNPFSCKFFDEALHGVYKGDLYVASAGNEGLDDSTMTSRVRTIGNPAACKNTLAGKYHQQQNNKKFIAILHFSLQQHVLFC